MGARVEVSYTIIEKKDVRKTQQSRAARPTLSAARHKPEPSSKAVDVNSKMHPCKKTSQSKIQ